MELHPSALRNRNADGRRGNCTVVICIVPIAESATIPKEYSGQVPMSEFEKLDLLYVQGGCEYYGYL